VAWAHREGVPEGSGEPVFEGDAVVGGEAERALGGGRHRGVAGLAVLGVISSVPSRPASTHAAQRQAFTGRLATRLDWQTGHQWSYRVAGTASAFGRRPGGVLSGAGVRHRQ
jgi:hypothetical protein